MEFIKITKQNLPVLKGIFGIKSFPKCKFCGVQTNSKNISILPPFKATKKLSKIVLCGSPLCLSEYYGKLEKKECED